MQIKRSYIYTILLIIAGPLLVVVSLIVFSNIWITFILYHGVVCTLWPIIEIVVVKKEGLGSLLDYCGFRSKSRIWLFAGIGIGILFGGFTLLFFYLFGEYLIPHNTLSVILEKWGGSNRTKLLLVVYMIIGNGASEEWFWRGFVFKKLNMLFNKKTAILTGTLVFASYHLYILYLFSGNLPVSLLLFIGIIIAGLFWNLARLKSGMVWPSLISHMGAAVGYMGVYLLWG